MLTRARRNLTILVCLLLVAAASAAAAATAAPTRPAASLPAPAVLAQQRARFLQLAQKGVQDAWTYWRQPGGYPWYLDVIGDKEHWPFARLWSAYPLFEAIDSLAILEPTAAHKAAVDRFAKMAEQYWNPNLKGGGGFAFYITVKDPKAAAYFDDNGWWGLAFVDAYRATGEQRYLADAEKALRFIDTQGWGPHGGTWWDTQHHYLTAEPLAAAALIAAELYQTTHLRRYLQLALKYVAWADDHSWNAQARLYQRSDTSDVVMDYVEGMMIAAHVHLCRATGQRTWCAKAERLAAASADRFPADADWAPQYDAIYLRTLLDLYDEDGNPRWYELVYRNAARAATNAVDSRGLFLKYWDGRPYKPAGMLRTHAATISLFARLAQSVPPGGSRRPVP